MYLYAERVRAVKLCIKLGMQKWLRLFEEVAAAVENQTDVQSSPPGIVLHPASAIDETAVAQVQADLRRRILRAFVDRGRPCHKKSAMLWV